MQISIDMSHIKDFAAKLKTLSKCAFPVAIRKTVNDAAFNTKLKTIPKKTSSTFKKRQPNFFKANSKVIPAVGFNVKTMKADVGFFSNNLKGNNNLAVKDLEQQEHGGNIIRKDFIAESGARSGTGLVKANRRLGNIPNLNGKVAAVSSHGLVRGKLKPIKSRKQRFIRAAFLAKKSFRGYVLGSKNNNGSQTLSIINSITRSGGRVIIKRTPLYSFNKGRTVKANITNFMKRASYESAMEMNKMFIANAQLQFKKHLSK